MKLILSDVAAGYNLQKINDNFDKLQDTINNDLLFRRNPTGEPNQMVGSNLDMDGNKILNLPKPTTSDEPVRLQDLQDALVAPQANVKASNVLIDYTSVEGTTRTLQQKVTELVSVKDSGAIGDGSNSADAFSKTARHALALNPLVDQRPNMPFPPFASAYIDAGEYALEKMVDVQNSDFVWVAHPAAVIHNPQYLNGRLVREQKITGFHNGTADHANSLSILANRVMDGAAQVGAFTDPSQLSKGNGRDTVAFYLENTLPAALYGTSVVTSYSANNVVLSTPFSSDQLLQLRRGMVVQTRHTPQAYAGIVDSWTSNSINVTAWYLVDGSASGTPTTPTGTAGLDVNVFRKVWAFNHNTYINSDSYGNALNCEEIGVFNNKGTPQSLGGAVEVNGLYVANKGSYAIDANYIADGGSAGSTWGYKVNGNIANPFYYDGSNNPGGSVLQFLLSARNAQGLWYVQMNGNGNLELGTRGAANTWTLDVHTGATDVDYDSRLLGTGGTGTAGGGSFSIYSRSLLLQASNNIDCYTVFRPSTDGTLSNGQAGNRWSTIYAVNGTINTSDERDKEQIRDLSEVEKEVALKLKGMIKLFKFKDAVQKKGEDARWHCGVIAQQVQQVFADAGLNGFDYGILCYDEWEAEEEIRTEEGEVLKPATSAGNRYGIRYDELFAFIIATL